jgi:hypothetical protein
MKLYHLILVLVVSFTTLSSGQEIITKGEKSLPMAGEAFRLNGHDAFVILPEKVDGETPWVWYAPTLNGLPSKAEVWMFERFLAKGIAIAGIDVGESYGSVAGRKIYSDFYQHLVTTRKFSKKPCLLARSRGGLMLYSWAVENPEKVSGIAGIYPVCSFTSYPGIDKTAKAYGMTVPELEAVIEKHNPIDRLKPLAEAGVPILHLHGDSDVVVPHDKNTAIIEKRYKKLGGTMEVELSKGQGHNMWPGFFRSETLTDFAIKSALSSKK